MKYFEISYEGGGECANKILKLYTVLSITGNSYFPYQNNVKVIIPK